jgi:polysaccharide pyruvyl transferase WcaK-like protein
MHIPEKRFDKCWLLTKFLHVLYPNVVKHMVYKDVKSHLDRASAVLAVGGDNYSLDYSRAPKTCTDLDDLVVNGGKPLVIWCASVGPFSKNPDYERYMTDHLKKVYIFARESLTVEYLAELGLTENVYRVADPAFVMKPVEPDLEKFGLDIEPGSIGINLSPLMARFVSEGDIGRWTALAADIIDRLAKATDRKIYLIPHVMATKSNDDYIFMKQVLSLVTKSNERIILIRPLFNAAETKWVISKMSVFAGSRTHSTIAALSSYVPTLSFAYSIKAKGINRDIYGHADFCIGNDELNPQIAAEKTKCLLYKSEDIRKHLESCIPEIQKLAMSAGSALKGILGYS